MATEETALATENPVSRGRMPALIMRSYTIIVVSYNAAQLLPDTLGSLLRSPTEAAATLAAQVIVVDNASSDGSVELLRERFPNVPVIHNERNLGFAGGANAGIQAAETEVVVLLNSDVLVEPEAIVALGEAMDADPRIAVAGSKLLYPNSRTIQHAGGKITYPLALTDHYGYRDEDRGQYDNLRDVDYVTGAFFALRKSVLREIGLFDEGFFPAYFEETDLCYRARLAGYRVVYVPGARAFHRESVTTGKDTFQYFHFFHRNRLRFVLKHWSDRQLADDFFPAELARLRTLESRDEVDGLAAAYTDNLSALGGGARFFANPIAVTKLPTSQVRLRILEALANNAQWRAESVSNVEEKPVSSVDQTSTRLAKRAQIAEPKFTSPTAVLGPVIVAVRRFWNWMSTKWYVRQVIQQQNAFNAEVVATMSALEDRFAKLEEKLATWEGMAIAAERSWVALNRDVALLETRLQRLEDRLGAIEEQLHNLADERRYRAVPDDQR